MDSHICRNILIFISVIFSGNHLGMDVGNRTFRQRVKPLAFCIDRSRHPAYAKGWHKCIHRESVSLHGHSVTRHTALPCGIQSQPALSSQDGDLSVNILPLHGNTAFYIHRRNIEHLCHRAVQHLVFQRGDIPYMSRQRKVARKTPRVHRVFHHPVGLNLHTTVHLYCGTP